MYKDGAVRSLVTLTLFNAYAFKIFLQYRSYNVNILKPSSSKAGQAKRHSGKSSHRGNHRADDNLNKILDQLSQSSNKFKYHCLIVMGIHLTIVMKDALIIGLRYLPEKSPYRLIDCFLLGRTILTGTYTLVSQRFGFIVSGVQFGWIAFQVFCSPAVRLSCLEFLLHNPDKIQSIQQQVIAGRQQSAISQNKDKQNTAVEDFLQSFEDSPPEPVSAPESLVRYPVFEYREPVLKTLSQASSCADKAPQDKIRLRRNRDTASYHKLIHFTILFLEYCILGIILCCIPFVYTLTSVLVTRQGFELNYSTCVNYIKTLDPQERRQYAYIYMPDDTNRSSKPPSVALEYTDLISLDRPYNVVRLLADAVQSYASLTLSFLAFLFNTYIALMVVRDLENYLDPLEADLKQLIADLRLHRSARLQTYVLAEDPQQKCPVDWKYREFRAPVRKHEKWNKPHLRKQVTNVEVQLMDFWAMVADYNFYVVDFTCFVVFTWVVYSALAARYLLVAPDGVIHYELVGCQLFLTGYFLTIIGQYAGVTRRIRRLYPLMTIAMALDEDCVESKLRWPLMLTYFHPKPLYCFKISHFTLSWNFCLQVSDKSSGILGHQKAS